MRRQWIGVALLLSSNAFGDVLDDSLTPRHGTGLTVESKWATGRDDAARRRSFKPELAYGAADTAEVFLGSPRQAGEGAGVNLGVKWIPWRGTGGWFAGAQFEKSWTRIGGGTESAAEIKPIFGRRQNGWLIVVNPLFSWASTDTHSHRQPRAGAGLRLARELGDVNIGIEYATELGIVGRFNDWQAQGRTLTGTVGITVKGVDLKLELGRGLNSAADRLNGRVTLSLAL